MPGHTFRGANQAIVELGSSISWRTMKSDGGKKHYSAVHDDFNPLINSLDKVLVVLGLVAIVHNAVVSSFPSFLSLFHASQCICACSDCTVWNDRIYL